MSSPTSMVGPAQAGGFARRVLFRQALVGAAAFTIVGGLAPWALLLETLSLLDLVWQVCQIGALSIVLTGVLTWRRLRTNRYVLRALALESRAIDPEDIGALADLPFSLTARFASCGALAASLLLVPGVRPAQLDLARAISLMLITLTIVGAASVVHFVVVREATIRLIELSPPEPITDWLEHQAERHSPRRRIVSKILLAVVPPVALVGVGTVLVVHAHLRAFVERSHAATAVLLASTALEPAPGAVPDAGRDDAKAAAREFGFQARVEKGPLGPEADAQPHREPSGRLRVTVPLEDGQAVVRYAANLDPGVISSGALLAVLAVLLAAAVGLALGRAVAADLVLATQQVSALGTERVLRGQTQVAGPARFKIVAMLGRAVEALAERFRVFASAQERAIRAKKAAQRMKELLFASVSHDLKSPLNAILGFAELVRTDEPLTEAQTESLDLVTSRGRELLALIETILDAARVEAGQLQLLPQPVTPRQLLDEALEKAYDLHGTRVEVLIDQGIDGLPPLQVDPDYAPKALAVLIADALAEGEEPEDAVRISSGLRSTEATEPTRGGLHIEYRAGAARPSLLAEKLRRGDPTTMGRSALLRLSLARAIIELHGGAVEVVSGAGDVTVVSCWFPLGEEPTLGPPQRP